MIRITKNTLVAGAATLFLATCGSTGEDPGAPKPPPPPIRAAEGLFDPSNEITLGLPSLESEQTLLYRAAEDGYKFCHHPNLVVFQDRLRAVWSNGLVGEDENGQRILHSHTSDGLAWSTPVVLAEDPDGPDGPLAAVATGFHVAGDTLVAYNTAIMDKHPIHADNALYARTSTDAETWGPPRRLAEGFFIERPRALPGGRLLMPGQFADSQPRLMYTDSPDGLSGWKDGVIPPAEAFQFPEPNWFRRSDGTIVMVFRTKNEIDRLWASISADNGESWSQPVETNFRDSTARFSAGNLPDGTAFLITNPGAHLVRNPLTIALSRDGITFDRAYVVRGEPTSMRWEGLHKLDGWQYPSALAWKGHLYIVYSINKEDVGVTRIALDKLSGGTDTRP